MITEADAERALHWLQNNAAIIAQRHGERVYQEERLKSVLAEIALRSDAKSADARKWEALASEHYKLQAKVYADACEKEKAINIEAKVHELEIDLYRTQAANQRGRM